MQFGAYRAASTEPRSGISRQRQQLAERSPDVINRLAHFGDSSSPMPVFKLKDKSVVAAVIAPVRPAENYDDLDVSSSPDPPPKLVR